MSEWKNQIADLTKAATGPTLEIVSEVFLDGVAGAVVPGVGNAMLSYKQNRMERRVESVLKELINRQDELNNALSNLQIQSDIENVKGIFFEMLMDYAIAEPQDEKIKYLVNGYLNVAQIPQIKEDVVRMFYDTLAQTNLLDLRVLRLYLFRDEDSASNIMQDYQIDVYQYNMIREKLLRLGLINSRKEQQRDDNIDAIVEYLQVMKNGRNKKLQVKKVSRTDSYKLSTYGNRFIKFIESEYDIKKETEECE